MTYIMDKCMDVCMDKCMYDTYICMYGWINITQYLYFSYDFLNNIFFSLACFILRIYCIRVEEDELVK